MNSVWPGKHRWIGQVQQKTTDDDDDGDDDDGGGGGGGYMIGAMHVLDFRLYNHHRHHLWLR